MITLIHLVHLELICIAYLFPVYLYWTFLKQRFLAYNMTTGSLN